MATLVLDDMDEMETFFHLGYVLPSCAVFTYDGQMETK